MKKDEKENKNGESSFSKDQRTLKKIHFNLTLDSNKKKHSRNGVALKNFS